MSQRVCFLATKFAQGFPPIEHGFPPPFTTWKTRGTSGQILITGDGDGANPPTHAYGHRGFGGSLRKTSISPRGGGKNLNLLTHTCCTGGGYAYDPGTVQVAAVSHPPPHPGSGNIYNRGPLEYWPGRADLQNPFPHYGKNHGAGEHSHGGRLGDHLWGHHPHPPPYPPPP